MSNYQDITEALRELMDSKGVGAQKLASMTDIPKRFVDAILEGDFDKLPAKPYIRGYLFKISNVLGVDNESLWEIYRNSVDASTSGETDKLPSNRFAIKQMDSGKIVAILLVLVILIFFAVNLDRIIGKPGIDVALPESTDQEVLVVVGTINPDDTLTLNDQIVYTDDDGRFDINVQMEPGLNNLKFKIKRYLGRETTILRQVFYQPLEQQ